MIIDLQIIPHAEQRYPTCGDYWWDGDTLHIRVSKLGNERMEWLVAIHEYIEVMLGKFEHIAEPLCAAFDKNFEKRRACGEVSYDEPGNDPFAPYYEQHQIASAIEQQLAYVLHVNVEDYGKAVDGLGWTSEEKARS